MDIERLIISLTVAGVSTAIKGIKDIENIAEGKDSEIINGVSGKIKEIFANNREPNEELNYNRKSKEIIVDKVMETTSEQSANNFCDKQ